MLQVGPLGQFNVLLYFTLVLMLHAYTENAQGSPNQGMSQVDR